MTERRKPRPRRRHPAAAGRILAAGISASVTIGLSGVIAQATREADAAAGEQDALQPPAPVQQARPVIVQLVPQPASPGLVAPSQSLPPTTLAVSRPQATAATRAQLSRTTTRPTVVALPVRTSASPPTTRPAPVTTSSGSKP